MHAAAIDRGVNRRRNIPRQIQNDVAGFRSQLRGAGKPHGLPGVVRVGRYPRSDGAISGCGANGIGDLGQADAPAARHHFQRAGNIHHANSAAAILRTY